MEKNNKVICDKDKVELEEMDLQFKYMKKTFRAKVLRCPVCGQVYLTEEQVNNRVSEVEGLLEEK